MPVANINHVVVSGNLTRDVELKSTNSGTSVASIGIACNSTFKKDGNWESKPNFFEVTVWGKQAEICNEYLSKGSKVMIDGRLEWNKWENKEGQTNSRVIIVAQQIEFGSKKGDGGSDTKSDTKEPDEIF